MGKLAAVTCETAKPDKGGRERLLGDGDGLFLRIRQHGTKTWLIEYEFKGARRKYTIGAYDPAGAPGDSITKWLQHGRLSLTQARAIAGSWKTARRGGHDPAAEWEAQLAAEKSAEETARAAAEVEKARPTVGYAVEQFMAKHIAGKKSAAAIRYRLERLAALIGERKIHEVTRQEVIAALEKIAEGQREGKTAKQLAGEILTQAKRLWRFAEAREWVGESRIERLKRADIDARPNKRGLALHLDEVAELWKALGDKERCKADPVTVAAMRLLILTGQREDEVAGAEWSEIDMEAGLWRIPAARTKRKRTHIVHLAPQAMAILESIKPLTGDQRHTFASPVIEGQPIFGRSINNALLTMFTRGKLPGVTRCHVHDFRHTLITRLPDLGFEVFVGHKIANHRLPGMLSRYNHGEFLPLRQAGLYAWAERIEILASGGNVVPLKLPAA